MHFYFHWYIICLYKIFSLNIQISTWIIYSLSNNIVCLIANLINWTKSWKSRRYRFDLFNFVIVGEGLWGPKKVVCPGLYNRARDKLNWFGEGWINCGRISNPLSFLWGGPSGGDMSLRWMPQSSDGRFLKQRHKYDI